MTSLAAMRNPWPVTIMLNNTSMMVETMLGTIMMPEKQMGENTDLRTRPCQFFEYLAKALAVLLAVDHSLYRLMICLLKTSLQRFFSLFAF